VKGAFTGAIRDHKGLFTVAAGGTLFLTRSRHAVAAAVKLLRVIQEREVRPVGSTSDASNRRAAHIGDASHLLPTSSAGRFREDL
jgi:two-component system response regulator GlrR